MAFSENTIKNMATEIMRECQTEHVSAQYEFVVYMIELMLYSPRYSSRGIDRRHLENFVGECVRMIVCGDTRLHTLRMQFTVDSTYSALGDLVDAHLDSIEQCLKPLTDEILDAEPESDAAFSKLYRKISIYIVLASGLGNPAEVVTLKEGMAALESVFPAADLRTFVRLPRPERLGQLRELVQLVSGVRLFNRDCGRGGEGIADLTSTTLEAGAACRAALAAALASVMRLVGPLTAAAAAAADAVDAETDGAVGAESAGVGSKDTRVVDLLIFHRQYEVLLRRMISDVEVIAESAALGVERARAGLRQLHQAVRYRSAVPAAAVYPLFKDLWSTWRGMQNMMFLLATVHRLMTGLASIQDQVKIPLGLLEETKGSDDRSNVAIDDLALAFGSDAGVAGESVQFLGFCAVCLTAGALVPGHIQAGVVRCDGVKYGFCSEEMAKRFSADPRRYINCVLQYARDHIHLIRLLHLEEQLDRVRGVVDLVTRVQPTIQVVDRDIQTDTHPRESHVDGEYCWDMWQWKRRACQWASIVNRRTRSTQTHHSHARADVPCQTTERRDRAAQTCRDAAVNTDSGVTGDSDRRVTVGTGSKVGGNLKKACACAVGADGDIDDKMYEIIKKINDKLN